MTGKLPSWKLLVLVLIILPVCPSSHAQQAAVFTVDYTNPQLTPSHWRLTLHEDGSGQFDAEGGQPTPENAKQILAGDIHREVRLSADFRAQVFSTARQRKLFALPCESRMKVAFQGTKRFSYSGPEGSGACEFNYSKDKDIQALGNSLVAVETTIMSGARMEKLLQHDRLGLDWELQQFVATVHDGEAIEVCTIREILERIASDEQVLERARRNARLLLTQARE
jgi:hypothetical protein